jgi:Zn-dependent peptidase ImmA (M78 family)
LNKVRANQIAKKALQTRLQYLGVKPSVPICPFNLAETMGFDVRFVKISSFEGMYLADDLVILIGAERPEGRKSFTCAHEIGHHVLGHGTVIDEIIESGSDKEIEQEADFFGGMLLMPESLIRRIAKDLQIDFSKPDPDKLYIASRYIGASFTGLVTHLHFNLKLVDYATYKSLKKLDVGSIKKRLSGEKVTGDVFVVGDWWKDKAIDMCVGDLIVSAEKCEVEGSAVALMDGKALHKIVAVEPGLSKITAPGGWSAYIRVCRKDYVGMNQYRFEEDVE